MAKSGSTAGAGNQAVGKVFILFGTAKAVSPDGTVRVLAPNSPIYADDRIITGSDGSVSIQFDGPPVTQLDLGRMTEIVIDEDVYSGVAPEAVTEAAAEADKIQEALLAGDDEIDIEATAAGGTTGAGGGHPIVNFDLDGNEVTPGSGAGTTGINLTTVDTLGGVPDDSPTILATSDVTVDETGGLDTVSGTLTFNYGNDGPGAIVLSADGATWDAGTLTLTADDGTWKTVVNGDGTYTFTQLAAIDHPDTGNPDDAIAINITATVTDVDGDSVSQGIVINVLDDGPTVGENTLLQLDDDALDGIPGGTGDDVEATDLTGTLAHTYGTDGAGTVLLTGVDLPTAGGFTYEVSEDGLTLTIYQDQGGDEPVAVQSIALTDDTSGDYTVTQIAAIMHPEGETENNVDFTINYQVMDGDGDTADGTLTINIDDDTPVLLESGTDSEQLDGGQDILVPAAIYTGIPGPGEGGNELVNNLVSCQPCNV